MEKKKLKKIGKINQLNNVEMFSLVGGRSRPRRTDDITRFYATCDNSTNQSDQIIETQKDNGEVTVRIEHCDDND